MKPKIVCLCGPSKFHDEFLTVYYRETAAGHIVLSVDCPQAVQVHAASIPVGLGRAACAVLADGHQFVRGVSLNKAPLGDEWDQRWRDDLTRLEAALDHVDSPVSTALSGPEDDKLRELHLRKIDLCDEVFIINGGGEVDERTKRELAYAIAVGKPVRWLIPALGEDYMLRKSHELGRLMAAFAFHHEAPRVG